MNTKKKRKPNKNTRSSLEKRTDQLMELLEDRVLFDAVPDGSLDLMEGIEEDPFAPMTVTDVDPTAVSETPAEECATVETPRNELVFVDKSLADYQSLVAELLAERDADVYFLDQTVDGVEQIAQFINGQTDVDAIHIISHGTVGALRLGTATLDLDSIEGQYTDELATIRESLDPDADILIYGCNFGQGDDGLIAINALANATGADVAASTDNTGHADLGGDWDLEQTVGSIETQTLTAIEWNHLLPPLTTTDMTTLTANDLADLLLGSGMTYSSASFTGGTVQGGTFSGALTAMPGVVDFDDGLIFSSGNIADISGPNDSDQTSTIVNSGGDAEFGANTYDAAFLEITFTPTSDTLVMNYVFGSEEYNEYVNGSFNDNMRIFVNGVSVALTPQGDPVGIDTINDADTYPPYYGNQALPASNPDLYINNDPGFSPDETSSATYDTDMDGFTVTLHTIVTVNPGVENTIKLGVADVGDPQLDSWLVVEANSLIAANTPVANDDSFTVVEDGNVNIDVVANDTDADGDPLTVTEIDGTAVDPLDTVAVTNGNVTLNGDGTLTFTPTPGYTGPASFTYTASDGILTNEGTVSGPVTAANSPPTVDTPIADVGGDDGDAITPIDVSGNFSDIDGDPLTFSATNLPPGLSINPATGIISGTIDPSASTGGPYSVDITADDGNGGTVTDTFIYTVSNPAPVAGDDAAGTPEDTPLVDSVAGNDSDPDGDALSYSLDTAPTNGSVVVNADGSYTYTPDPDFNGVDTFTYQVDDGEGGTDTATVTVTVSAVQDPPVVDTPIADLGGDDGETITPVDVSGNFNDVDGDPLTFSATNLPPGLTIDPATGIISGTIDPSASTGGPYSVDITVDDGNGGTVTDTFIYTVSNPAPVAGDDAAGTPEDTPLVDSVAGNDSDPDGDTLTYTLGTPTSNGSVVVNADGSYIYTPDPDFNGVDTFTYQVDDGEGGTDTATVVVTVSATNDPPVVDTPIVDQSSDDGETITPVDVSGNFSDVEGDPLTFSATNLPPGLSIDPATGIISGTIDSDASAGGPYSVDITADDGNGGTITDTFIYTVSNLAPIALDDAAGTSEDTPLVASVAGNDSDPDGDTLTYSLNTAPTNGSVVVNADGSYTYTPDPDFNGIDTFTYLVDDSEGGTDIATVTIAVSAINDPPVVDTPIADLGGDDGETITPVDVSGNFSDVEGDPLTFSATNLPPGLSIDPVTGIISGTIDPSASTGGPYSVDITANDGNGGTVTDTFIYTVSNLAPVAGDDAAGTAEDTPLVGSVTANDSDPEGDTLTYSLDTAPTNGSVVVNPDGSYIYTPDPDFNGVDTFTYLVDDGEGGTDTATVVVTISAVQDPPVVDTPIVDISSDDNETITPIDISGNFSDPDGDPLTFSATNLPPGLSIDLATGIISGTIDPSASVGGPYSVDITADDGNGGTVTDTFVYTVTNPAPVAGNDLGSTPEDTPLVGSVTANDSDPDGDALTYSLDTAPTNGSAVVNPDGSYTYTPDPEFNGVDTFTYLVDDGEGGTNTATVTITVAAVQDPPVVDTPIADVAGDDGESITPIDISGNFSDPDGDPLTFSATNLPPGLTIDPATGIISGTIDPSASTGGPYSVDITADDGNGGTITDTFIYTVSNPAPVAGNDVGSTPEDTPLIGSVTANDSDPDGDPLTYSLDTAPTNGSVVFNPDGSYTYTPDPEFNGVDTFTYLVDDGQGGTDTATVAVTVAVTQDPPVVDSPIADVAGDDGETITPIDVSGNFNDPDGDPLTFSATNLPPGLSIDPATGIISGTIDPDASTGGPYSVDITADDGNGGTITDTFIYTVSNTVPVAGDDAVGTPEDTPLVGSVTANDSDPDGDPLTYSLDTPPTNGSVVLNPDGSYTYTPDPDFNGVDTFTYLVDDGEGGTDTATVAITVATVQDPPVVDTPIADVAGYDGETIAPVDVSTNFSDPDGDPLTFSATNLPPGLSIDPVTGIISGTIDSDASTGGPYSVDITADDGNGGTITETYIYTVSNPAPVPGDDAAVTPEDTPLVDSVAANDSDPDGDTLTYSLDTAPTNGSVVMNPDGLYIYTPDPDFNGVDTFTYLVDDGEGGTDTATVTVTVSAVQDPPVVDTPIVDIGGDDGETITPVDVSGNFVDVDGDPLTFSATNLPPGLSIDPATGIISGTIDPNASTGGPYSVDITVDDGNGGTITDTFIYTVSNPAPVAGDDSVGTPEDTPLAGTVTANDSDPDGDPLTYSLDTPPTNGSVVVNPDGTYTYTPDPGYNGIDTFTYLVDDGEGGTDTATVTVAVGAVNDPPTVDTPIVDLGGNDGETITPVDVSGNFSDVDGDPLTFSATNLPPGLSIDPATGIISGTIDPDASTGGPYSVDITADDGNGATVTDTFVYTVSNPAPVAGDDVAGTPEDTPLAGSVAANDSDPDGDTLTYSLDTPPTNGSVVVNPDGTYTYTPDPDFNGTDTFTYLVDDGEGGTDTATVTVTVSAVNDPPTVDTPIVDVGGNDGETITPVDVSGNFSDPDGDPLTFSATNLPPGLSIDPATGIISGTIDPDASTGGPYSVDITADDGNGGTITDTFIYTVSNPAPVAGDDAVGTPEDTPLAGSVSANDSDPDGDTLTYSLDTPPTNGSVVVNPDGTYTYTPDPGYNGTDTFTYLVDDGEGGTDTATVTVTVASVNDPPTVDTPIVDVGGDDGETITPIDVSGNFSDPDGDPLTFSATNLPPGLSIDPATGIISGTIDPDASTGGPYSVDITADDGNGGTITDTFIYTVSNPAPVANDDAALTPGNTPLAGSVTANDSDPDGDTIQVVAVDGDLTAVGQAFLLPSGAIVTLNADGTYVYDPNGAFDYLNLGESAADGFSYTISDGQGGTSTATVSITIEGSTAPPVAEDDTIQVNNDQTITIPVLDNDANPGSEPLAVILLSQPESGSVQVNPNGTITYTPDPLFEGTVTFQYLVEDSFGGSDTAEVTLHVSSSYRWDSFNDPGNDPGRLSSPIQRTDRSTLSQEIHTLAPEPIFSGFARPGVQITGRVYDESGVLIKETSANTDPGGNWMMQIHGLERYRNYRVEFEERADTTGIYGYLGLDSSNNSYWTIHPLTRYDAKPLSVEGAIQGSAYYMLEELDRELNNPIGFGEVE